VSCATADTEGLGQWTPARRTRRRVGVRCAVCGRVGPVRPRVTAYGRTTGPASWSYQTFPRRPSPPLRTTDHPVGPSDRTGKVGRCRFAWPAATATSYAMVSTSVSPANCTARIAPPRVAVTKRNASCICTIT